ncbi:MAG: hypothetical protein CFE23_08555 [Flavobacterium sp. BFFFF1]|uniref:DUF5683 domain-containing protein n=1 Tax=unclassified Flavobacterium TaxID=196869 RepID=UPI000BDA8620|nr:MULTISPECIES: DUF5683 domain-containing protein [unclassified Flavobacterium]OYU80530.1 MAG: hypothetical protein CFE23_08555 [Flavobacterium sp. BFFFF1]
MVLCAQTKKPQPLLVIDTTKAKPLNPLAPTKAAFYSAILPGLGQAYNKRYWKIPIVYGALGTGVYFFMDNNKKYHRFRDAYKIRIAGGKDEFDGQYSDATLINAQKVFQRNRDLSFLITVGLYVLNIVDANVDAHLLQFNVNDNLSLRPDYYQNDINYKHNVGLSLNYQF